MTAKTSSTPSHPPAFSRHGASELPTVTVEAYNAEIRDGDGFLGDRASNGAFREILEEWRDKLRKVSDDPLGDVSSDEISKKKLDKILAEGEPEAAGLVQSAIGSFARELAAVTQRFLKLKSWKGVQRIAIGGGLRASRVGELAIGRASVELKAAGQGVDLVPILHHPDEAGLVGTLHLAPSWIFTGFDAALAVDIGGSNIRAGIVTLDHKKSGMGALETAKVHAFELWRHADDKPKRDEAIERLCGMLADLVKRADKDGLRLAPFVGVGCPGVIEEDGAIARGAQNLPGNWESSRFNLPRLIHQQLPQIGGHETHVLVHNDAVVQGLSQAPWMTDVAHWGVLTIGTGLGNAAFTHKSGPSPD